MGILTITLNAAINAAYVVEGYAHGGANRVLRGTRCRGARATTWTGCWRRWARLSPPPGSSGAMPGASSRPRSAGIAAGFGWLATGESRTCHTILEQDTGIATEILEAGPSLTQNAMDDLLIDLPVLLDWADTVVVSGSSPPGATPAFLEALAAAVRQGASRFAVDSSGETLQALLTGKPDVVKPNEDEIRQLMGRSASLDEQVALVQGDVIGTTLPDDAEGDPLPWPGWGAPRHEVSRAPGHTTGDQAGQHGWLPAMPCWPGSLPPGSPARTMPTRCVQAWPPAPPPPLKRWLSRLTAMRWHASADWWRWLRMGDERERRS